MNILEEQNMNGETNRPLKANSEAPNVVPSAKKVYSKPTLVILSPNASQGTNKNLYQSETTTNGATAGLS